MPFNTPITCTRRNRVEQLQRYILNLMSRLRCRNQNLHAVAGVSLPSAFSHRYLIENNTITTMKFSAACSLAFVASASAFAPAPLASVSIVIIIDR